MSQTYIDSILDLYGMKNAKQVATTGSVTIVKTVSDTPLSPEEHSVYRTAVGKLLWLALIRGDVAYATKELSRDVTAPTMQSIAKLKHLLRYLIGAKMCVLRLRPSYQLSDGNCSLEVNVYVGSDWAGCLKTSDLEVDQRIHCEYTWAQHGEHCQDPMALSSGEAELYALGQGKYLSYAAHHNTKARKQAHRTDCQYNHLQAHVQRSSLFNPEMVEIRRVSCNPESK
eukprot:s4799_g7.t1